MEESKFAQHSWKKINRMVLLECRGNIYPIRVVEDSNHGVGTQPAQYISQKKFSEKNLVEYNNGDGQSVVQCYGNKEDDDVVACTKAVVDTCDELAKKKRCDVEKGPRAEGHACNSSSVSRVIETVTAIVAHNVRGSALIDTSGLKEDRRETVGNEGEWERRRDGGMVGSGGFIRSLSSNDLRRLNITLEVVLNKDQLVDTGIGPIIPSDPYKDRGIGPYLVGGSDNQPSNRSLGLPKVAGKQPIVLHNISYNQEAQVKQKGVV